MKPPYTPPTLADYGSVTEQRPVAQGTPAQVSIITVARNAASTLGRTIDSVQQQTGPTIEHVVVDGGSTDGTLDLLRQRLRSQDFWISELDRGIADAFNKGVALARGTYVQFLNADDWFSDGQVARAVEVLETTGADFVFGDLVFHRDGQPAFRYRGDPHYAEQLHRHLPPVNHPTLVARRTLFEGAGLFCLQHGHAMEYDWLQRVHRRGGRGVHDARIIGHMTHEGVSNLAFKRTVREVRDIAIAHGASPLRAYPKAWLNIAKTSLSHRVRAWSPALYERLRSQINDAYEPITVDRPAP